MKKYLICALLVFLLFGCSSQIMSPSSSSVTTNSTAEQISVPSAYNELLSDYSSLVEWRLSDSFEREYNDINNTSAYHVQCTISNTAAWLNMLVEMTGGLQSPNKESFGYALKDINKDGSKELFWLRTDGRILAVFTKSKGQIHCVAAFWSKCSASVLPGGLILVRSVSGAYQTVYTINKLPPNSEQFVISKEFGTDGTKETHNGSFATLYYELINGQKTYISERAFNDLLQVPHKTMDMIPLD